MLGAFTLLRPASQLSTAVPAMASNNSSSSHCLSHAGGAKSMLLQGGAGAAAGRHVHGAGPPACMIPPNNAPLCRPPSFWQGGAGAAAGCDVHGAGSGPRAHAAQLHQGSAGRDRGPAGQAAGGVALALACIAPLGNLVKRVLAEIGDLHSKLVCMMCSSPRFSYNCPGRQGRGISAVAVVVWRGTSDVGVSISCGGVAGADLHWQLSGGLVALPACLRRRRRRRVGRRKWCGGRRSDAAAPRDSARAWLGLTAGGHLWQFNPPSLLASTLASSFYLPHLQYLFVRRRRCRCCGSGLFGPIFRLAGALGLLHVPSKPGP